MKHHREFYSVDPWGLAGIASLVASALFMCWLVYAAITLAESKVREVQCARCATDTECAVACGGDGSPE